MSKGAVPSLLFVGDGPRDAQTVPPLVRGILQAEVRSGAFRQWSEIRLQRGSGFDRKLLFAMTDAVDEGCAGVVATVDRDKTPGKDRLTALAEGRDRAREKPHLATLPVAVGEAIPHGEAWLLDDAEAVRAGLGLNAQTDVPNVRDIESPKKTLAELKEKSPRRDDSALDVLRDIAAHVDPARSRHAKETGFERFQKDVSREIAPLIPAR